MKLWKNLKKAGVCMICAYDPLFMLLAGFSIGVNLTYYIWGDRQYAAGFDTFSWIIFWLVVARYLWLVTPLGQQLADRLMGRGPLKMHNR